MIRRAYQWLIALHPPQFRDRFGGEMACIFDESQARERPAMFADGLASLARQWLLRAGYWRFAAAMAGAVAQIVVASLFGLAMVRRVSSSFSGMDAGGVAQPGYFLLLVAGILTAALMGLTILAVWMRRFAFRRPVRRLSKRHSGTIGALLASLLFAAVSVKAQKTVVRPAFEVASVKLNTSGCPNGRGGGGSGGPAPGRLDVRCITVLDLIQAAYGTFANGPNMSERLPDVLGAPDWVGNDTYDIAAKPAGPASIDQIYGPMLQVLLEDRFRLRIHRETRELPVYTLTIAAGGAKLQATKEGSCVAIDVSHMPPQPAPGQPPTAFCGRTSLRRTGPNMTVDAFGIDMASFVGKTLSTRLNLDRPVVDKTGLTGRYDVHLEFAPASAAGQAGIDSAASIFTALREQLGLRLAADQGPVDVLVVDHIERPSAN